jgi:sodium-independent sulfate anion transporter 11
MNHPVKAQHSVRLLCSVTFIDIICFFHITGLLVLLALGVLTEFFKYIPSAALAGLIIVAVLDMVDFAVVRRLWRVKRELEREKVLLNLINDE